jgi:transcriptional regulator with XRE-family HTH domain
VVATLNSRKVPGKTIRAYREAAGLSQENLAKLAELSRNFIGMVERGENTISVDALRRIAQVLKVRTRDLHADI